jgi:hypothetical protein
MADEEPDGEEFVELDEDGLDEEVLDDDVVVAEDLDDDVVEVVVDDEVEAPATPAARKKGEDDDDDDDEVDPDDVEADLDRILKDRIAANEDEEDEEEAVAPRPAAETPDGVQPKKAHEFTCTGCFLLVNPGQFGPVDHMECPVGEEICPAITQLKKQLAKARK